MLIGNLLCQKFVAECVATDYLLLQLCNRWQVMFKDIKKKCWLGGEVEDWFWRIEFQKRGSPHVHMLLWIK